MTGDDEDRLPDRLMEAARGYRAAGDVPRDAMWRAIAAGRDRRRAARRRLRWGLALAATLVLGIGIGRLAGPRNPAGTAAVGTASSPASTAYRVAAGQYFARTEVLLTELRSQSRRDRPSAEFLTSARDLLTTTRLLLDSPAARDPRLASLLQDLELVLAQVSQLADEPGLRGELDLIDQSITQSGVLSRLRATTPAAGRPARI